MQVQLLLRRGVERLQWDLQERRQELRMPTQHRVRPTCRDGAFDAALSTTGCLEPLKGSPVRYCSVPAESGKVLQLSWLLMT